jgi:hypothetical protein
MARHNSMSNPSALCASTGNENAPDVDAGRLGVSDGEYFGDVVRHRARRRGRPFEGADEAGEKLTHHFHSPSLCELLERAIYRHVHVDEQRGPSFNVAKLDEGSCRRPRRPTAIDPPSGEATGPTCLINIDLGLSDEGRSRRAKAEDDASFVQTRTDLPL